LQQPSLGLDNGRFVCEIDPMNVDARKIVSFDTSAINRLADDQDSDALIAGLTAGYFVRSPFTAVSEIIAASSGERRRRLLTVCRNLLAAGDCIEPHHEILKLTVQLFERSASLDTAHVNLRMIEAENEILRAENFDDELAEREREENRANDRTFCSVYAAAKKPFDEIAAQAVANGTRMPASVGELVEALQKGGAFWTLARNLYQRMATREVDDATLKLFYAKCDPFRSLMLAIFAAQYDRCIRQPNDNRSLRSGRNDTFMATCLPYCDEFVTDDRGQLACYQEVVALAGLYTTVRSFDDFRDGLFVVAGTRSAT
jgi:hypothetical protein